MLPLGLKIFLSRGAGPRLWAGYVAALLVAVGCVLPLRTDWPNDFYGFWIVGQTAKSAFVNDIYGYRGQIGIAKAGKAGVETAPTRTERAMRKGHAIMDLTASPFHYSVYAWFSTGDLMADYSVFNRLNGIIYVVAIIAVATYLRYPFWSFPVLVFVFTVPFWPFRRDILDANGSALLAGAAMLATLLLPSARGWVRWLAGFTFGLLVAFKPTVLFAPVLTTVAMAVVAPRSLVPFITGGLAGVGAAMAASLLTLGDVATWTRWLEHAPTRAFEVRHVSGGLLGRFVGVDSPLPYHIATLTLAAMAAGWVIRSLRGTARLPGRDGVLRPKRFELVAAAAAGLNIYLLSGMLVWGHYFTLAVPSALIALRPRPHRAGQGWPALVCGGIAFAMLAFHQYFRAWGLTSWGNYSPITIAATVWLTGQALWDLRDHWRQAERIIGEG